MPYTPQGSGAAVLTSRAWAQPGWSWESIPGYSTFRVRYNFATVDEGTIANPVSRAVHNQMIDPAVGTWSNWRFVPASPGRYRFLAQLLIAKEYSQSERTDTFLQLELLRGGVSTTLARCDSVRHLVEGGELLMPLVVEATPRLIDGDQVSVRFGALQNEVLGIGLADPTRSFLEITAYGS